MSKNAKTSATRNNMVDRANARAERVVSATGAFGQKWSSKTNPAKGLVFNPYAARAGEIRACVRLTAALLKEGESVHTPSVRTVVRTKNNEGEFQWDWVRTPGAQGAVFIGPWLTETRVGGTWSPLRPIRVARESTPEGKEEIEREKALVGWLNAAADLAEEMKKAGDRLGMTCLRKFFEAGVTGSGSGPNSPYCSHVGMHEVIGRMSPGRLVRRMIEVRFAARRRMHPLAGVIKTPSWAAVVVAATQSLPVGKASIVAMAMTLEAPRLTNGGGGLRHYRAAREWLTNNLATSTDKVEEIEGVTTVTRPATVIHGIRVSRTAELSTSKRGGVGSGGRREGFLGSIGGFHYHGNTWDGERYFVKTVLAEYRKYREAMATATREAAFTATIEEAVASGKIVILATWQDSYDAGNCSAGTLAFAHRIGVANRQWIDVAILLGSGNTRAVAAGHIAMRRAAEQFARMRVSA